MTRANSITERLTRQEGVVLVASLFVLLVITLLTVSTFKDVNLQEKMAGNYRVKARTFEAANAAAQEFWLKLMTLQGTEQVTDVRTRDLNTEFDVDTDGDGTVDADLTVAISICYDGTEVAPGTDEEYVSYKFFVTADGSDPSGARSQVRQGGYVIGDAVASGLPTTCI